MRRDRGQDEITERQSPEPAPVVRHLAPNWPMRTMPAPLASKVWTIARLSSACGAIDVILMRLAGISLAEVLWRAWYFGDGGLLHHVGRTPGSNGRDERRHLQSAAARHARVLPSCRLRWLFAAMNSELDFLIAIQWRSPGLTCNAVMQGFVFTPTPGIATAREADETGHADVNHPGNGERLHALYGEGLFRKPKVHFSGNALTGTLPRPLPTACSFTVGSADEV